MINALTFDLEDWFCVHYLEHTIKEEWDKCEQRAARNTKTILDLLDKHNVKATFFVLGWIAERIPDLIREIDICGHEVATHGYSHTLLTRMTPESFEEDLTKAIKVTEVCMNQSILGFRAPAFSITNSNFWTLDVLIKKGIKYDSSIFPIDFHPDYGVPNGLLSIYQIRDSLIEVPLSCVEVLGKRLPCSGGAYFRMFPYPLSKLLLRKCNSQDRPFIFYLHPWEIDPELPRLSLSWFTRFRYYHNLDKTLKKLDSLLKDFQFTSIKSILGL